MEEAGGFAAQLSDIEEVSAYHGDNYEVLVHRFFRMDRAVMFDLASKLNLVATSSDASMLAALEHARAWHGADVAEERKVPLSARSGAALAGLRVPELQSAPSRNSRTCDHSEGMFYPEAAAWDIVMSAAALIRPASSPCCRGVAFASSRSR